MYISKADTARISGYLWQRNPAYTRSDFFKSLSEAVLSQLDVEELNPETAGCSRVTLLQTDVNELNPKIASHLGVH